MFSFRNRYNPSAINFSNPTRGRQWLKLLKPSMELGLSLKPCLSLDDRKALGFTFRVNEFGFHGEANSEADNVILGTSFAMGFGVDEGRNWFQLDPNLRYGYFNLGIPVSPLNHLNALSKYYKGKFGTLIYVYHPNVWKTASSFYRAERAGLDIFKFLRWRVSLLSMARLMPRWYFKKLIYKFNEGEIIHKESGSKYCLNTNYNKYNSSSVDFDYSVANLVELFSKFKSVFVFRVPIKEQIACDVVNNKKLRDLCNNYDECWSKFVGVEAMQRDGVEIIDLCKGGGFDLSDYLPYDTHWGPSGNAKFVHIVNRYVGLERRS